MPKGMVEKGLERESDDVIVGESRRTETIIVRIVMFKIIHEPEIKWTGRVGT